MRHRIGRLLLFFSLGLNVAFVTLAVVRARESQSESRELRRVDFSPRWHGRRATAMSRALRLDSHQRTALRERLGAMRPELQSARRELFSARDTFRTALSRNDVTRARQARMRLSQAQTRLDSLSAEAMLTEIADLSPEQRERYLRWTLDRRRLPPFRGSQPYPKEEEPR